MSDDVIEKAADLIEAWLRSGYDTSDDDDYQATIIARALADAGLLPTETEWGVQHVRDPEGRTIGVPSKDDLHMYGDVWLPKIRHTTPWKDAS